MRQPDCSSESLGDVYRRIDESHQLSIQERRQAVSKCAGEMMVVPIKQTVLLDRPANILLADTVSDIDEVHIGQPTRSGLFGLENGSVEDNRALCFTGTARVPGMTNRSRKTRWDIV